MKDSPEQYVHELIPVPQKNARYERKQVRQQRLRARYERNHSADESDRESPPRKLMIPGPSMNYGIKGPSIYYVIFIGWGGGLADYHGIS